MSDEDFLALGASERVELFDGALWIRRVGAPRHQHIAGCLVDLLRAEGVHVLRAVHVRLKPARILIPDVVIASEVDFDEPAVAGDSVLLVGEVVTTCGASVTKVLKMQYYAEAGIPWCLLIDHGTGALHLHELDGGHYVQRSVTTVGEVLHLTDPVDATISPERLLPPPAVHR
ncbi:Uma2 family endonuclease [Actinoplanes sp. NPDC049548]|uniref:Uma2 family endonuclease n=1 Tax=Actinoplanes sp. NPDC049548 TaxID=3155152 RepID=UPI003416B52F